LKILAIHNTLWTHYKGDIYSRIHKRCEEEKHFDFQVIHLATTEHDRSLLGNVDLSEHQYPYEVLFDEELEKISTKLKIRSLLQKVSSIQPKLIYLNGYYDVSYWFIMIYAKTKGIKILLDSESTELSRERSWWKERLKKMVLPQLDGYLCLGSKATEYLLKLGVKKEKIFSSKNIGIANDKVFALFQKVFLNREEEKNKLNLPKFNFIYAGRFTFIKNLVLLIEAFEVVSEKYDTDKNWGLVLSGDGSEKKNLQDLVSSKQLKNVTFFPSCEWHEVPGRYALADVSVLPSLFEPFGFLVNESLVYGMPVIVSNRCGSAFDLVENGENGFTFDPSQLSDLVEKMKMMIENTDQFKIMGEKGQNIVKKFHPDAICEDIIKAFKTILIL
jgi:glycosyltransferase involved in cell wall biosynthesis